MQRAAILLVIIVGAILIAAALQDRGAEINDRKAQAGAATTATEIIDPAQATIEALQTQIAGLMGTVEPTINPTDATIEALQTQAAGLAGGEADPISTPEPKSTAKAEDNGVGNDGESTKIASCPETVSGWLGMISSRLGESGNVRNNRVLVDQDYLVKVNVTKAWVLPSGWEAIGAGDVNYSGGDELSLGVYSFYPPHVCRPLDLDEA